ncbi:hypothetical protein CDCA_CDCA10G2957 [Cyanidium caldarium]|uniref:Uncharacterized protein n=1 Tax=Cyanidium caldarium TaxID=2771 RepID=A0AAV9IXD0_CYACA|nr:hypothetical protein CDCA_CDCA10G2957 [Cyanidium caldarium]|eukprot:ctg_3005.g534
MSRSGGIRQELDAVDIRAKQQRKGAGRRTCTVEKQREGESATVRKARSSVGTRQRKRQPQRAREAGNIHSPDSTQISHTRRAVDTQQGAYTAQRLNARRDSQCAGDSQQLRLHSPQHPCCMQQLREQASAALRRMLYRHSASNEMSMSLPALADECLSDMPPMADGPPGQQDAHRHRQCDALRQVLYTSALIRIVNGVVSLGEHAGPSPETCAETLLTEATVADISASPGDIDPFGLAPGWECRQAFAKYTSDPVEAELALSPQTPACELETQCCGVDLRPSAQRHATPQSTVTDYVRALLWYRQRGEQLQPYQTPSTATSSSPWPCLLSTIGESTPDSLGGSLTALTPAEPL